VAMCDNPHDAGSNGSSGSFGGQGTKRKGPE
jgi:hypothetical protein